MAIERVEIKDFLVFKGEFTTEFCSGVNVIIGGNGTGKTTLLKAIYMVCDLARKLNEIDLETAQHFSINPYFLGLSNPIFSIRKSKNTDTEKPLNLEIIYEYDKTTKLRISGTNTPKSIVFIQEKDMLSNSKGLPEIYKYGKAEYTQFEIDVIEKARVLATCPEQPLYREICDIIGGEPQNDGQSFFMKRHNVAELIPFSSEAAGYRNFGLLASLIRNEQITHDSILFWDNPENNLNPELIPALIDILLELQRGGVQIFVATHSYDVARWFELNKKPENELRYFNFRKEGENIIADVANDYISLENNSIEAADNKLFKRVVEFSAERTEAKQR